MSSIIDGVQDCVNALAGYDVPSEVDITEHLDSLDIAQLYVELEDEFDIELDGDTLQSVRTVEQIAELLRSEIAQ